MDQLIEFSYFAFCKNMTKLCMHVYLEPPKRLCLNFPSTLWSHSILPAPLRVSERQSYQLEDVCPRVITIHFWEDCTENS
uniref:Uncharacterized protein n=2 Tax=Manihot esculenta TaxID=3983 RepID=A0A199U9C1_MANES